MSYSRERISRTRFNNYSNQSENALWELYGINRRTVDYRFVEKNSSRIHSKSISMRKNARYLIKDNTHRPLIKKYRTDPIMAAIQENRSNINKRPKIDFDGIRYE